MHRPLEKDTGKPRDSKSFSAAEKDNLARQGQLDEDASKARARRAASEQPRK